MRWTDDFKRWAWMRKAQNKKKTENKEGGLCPELVTIRQIKKHLDIFLIKKSSLRNVLFLVKLR